jgi:hypothetical protein
MAKFAEASRELLEQALASNELRYFTASGGEAMGKTGPEDTAEFAELLVALQECAQLLGETLEMGAVSSAICVKGDETAGFCCDPNSKSEEAVITGAIVNRRMPASEFFSSIQDYHNSQDQK